MRPRARGLLLLLLGLVATACSGTITPDAATSAVDASIDRAQSTLDAPSPSDAAMDAALPTPMDVADTPSPDAAGPSEPRDRFGVRMIYPTLPAGREWYLPDDAERPSAEWEPDTSGATIARTSEPGVFRSTGSPRHNVRSPAGRAWWRNVEMTVYLRWESGADDAFTMYARGDRHTNGTATPSDVNDGVRAPAGTATWPGYPFTSNVPWECLGTAYKADLGTDGSVFYKKEVSHTAGYTDAAGTQTVFPSGLPHEWVGFKFVLRNMDGDRAVRLETWIDRMGDGRWEMMTSHEDHGMWAGDPASDGCDEAPFRYAQDQIVTWAGPVATLRADGQTFDFRWFSVREIAPLP